MKIDKKYIKEGGKVELFLKRAIQGGKRFRKVDPYTMKVDYKCEVTLYPHKGVLVSEETATHLLKQDPHLVSLEPYEGIRSDDEDKVVLVETNDIPKIEDAFDRIETTPEVIKKALQDLAVLDVSKLNTNHINQHFVKLGYKVKKGIPLKAQKVLLEECCKEAAQVIA